MFDKQDYETPDNVAQAMAKMILPTDKGLLEPFAGTGQLIDAILSLPLSFHVNPFDAEFSDDSVLLQGIEISETRYDKLAKKHPKYKDVFYNIDYFSVKENRFKDENKNDLIITNPPFDSAIAGIKKSLELLNDKPESRLLFLLPLPFFSSQGRSKEFNELDCHIAGMTLIQGRIDYLKDGVPMSKCQKEIDGVLQFKNGKPVMMSGRQESDAVFCIKKGKNPNSPINFLF